MSKFPDHIVISITSNGKPLPKVLFEVIVISNQKNNYTIGPFLTDAFGKSDLTKELVIKEINKAMAEFPMDYSSNLDNCKDVIVIKIEGKVSIEKKIQSLLRYYPDYGIELISAFENSINITFLNDFKIEKQINDRIEIALP